jgi:2-phospho-L-lactate/phosphoenolpyruvate guanylyltransferase
VSSAPEVVEWAHARGARVVADPGSLDGAADAGRAAARRDARDRVAIVHADLPLATTLDPVVGGPPRGVTVVPDRFDDGTPVIVVPTDAAFDFAFGPHSFARHCDEADRRGLELLVVRDRALGFDVDRPDDLDALPDAERCGL